MYSQQPVKSFLSILIIFFCSLFASQALAASKHNNLILQGISSYWSYNSELYIASLWLESTVTNAKPADILDAQGLKRMEFKVSSDKWRSRNFANTWTRSISINNEASFKNTYSNQISRFSRLAKKPLIYGDKVTIDLFPNSRVEFKVNDVLLYTTYKTDVFNGILKAWIGNKPPSSSFKQEILNPQAALQSGGLASDQQRYESIAPNNLKQRKQEISAWKAPRPKPKPVAIAKPKAQPPAAQEEKVSNEATESENQSNDKNIAATSPIAVETDTQKPNESLDNKESKSETSSLVAEADLSSETKAEGLIPAEIQTQQTANSVQGVSTFEASPNKQAAEPVPQDTVVNADLAANISNEPKATNTSTSESISSGSTDLMPAMDPAHQSDTPPNDKAALEQVAISADTEPKEVAVNEPSTPEANPASDNSEVFTENESPALDIKIDESDAATPVNLGENS